MDTDSNAVKAWEGSRSGEEGVNEGEKRGGANL